jgi:hypothetical protein
MVAASRRSPRQHPSQTPRPSLERAASRPPCRRCGTSLNRRNRFLTGREQALETLARHLNAGTTMAVTQAIQGTGGIGKTALAVEYAYRYRADFDTVWWVRAEEPGTLIGDYAGLAQALGLPAAAAAEQQTAVTAVRRWLTDHDRWLLVLDNSDGPQAMTGLPPPLAHLEDLLPQWCVGSCW